jgi:hypothetical protein
MMTVRAAEAKVVRRTACRTVLYMYYYWCFMGWAATVLGLSMF